MKKKDNNSKNVALFGVVSALSIATVTTTSDAGGSLEQEFLSIIDNTNSDNVIVENGIVVKKGERIDLKLEDGWKLSNENTVRIDSEGVLHPLNEGTVYISNEVDGKMHVIEVYVSEDEEPLLLANARSSTVNRSYYKVFVDPGHGGSDNGAEGNGYFEDELNLQLAKRVENKLKAKKIEVKMSRTTDVFYSLSERARMANSYGADVFVSIHQNSADIPNASGIETFYHTKKIAHKPLSNEIQTRAISTTGATNRGVKSANLGVLRESTMPSTLFEAGFISNPTEGKKLGDVAYQDKLATAIANGIEAYLKSNIQLSGSSGNSGSSNNSGGNINTDLPVIKNGTVTADNLNVRSGAGTSYSKVGTLTEGSKVEIVSESNGWYKIKYNSGYGFISASYVSTNSDNSSTETSTTIANGEVTTNNLNVRSGPGTSFTSKGKLSKGAKVEIVGEESGWYKIKYSGSYAYVSASYVKKVNSSTSSSSSTPTPIPPVDNTVNVINKGVVTTDSLNVRSGYGTSYSKIGSLSRNAKVEIVESKNGWYKIKYGSGYGYVSGDYVKLDYQSSNTPTQTTTPPSTTKKGVVTTNSLNVRSGYGTSYSKIGSLSLNKEVEIVESKNGWHKIKYGSGYGYVSGDYIKITTSGSNSGGSSSTTIKKGTVTTNNLNVRKGGGTSYASIGKLNSPAKVEIVETKNGWHKIKYGSGYGYVSASYVKI